MEIEELKNLVLRRLYDGAFLDDVDYQVNLREFASDKQIDPEQMSEVFDILNDDGFFKSCCIGMVVTPSTKALAYCENHQLVDQEFFLKQNEIRKRILEALMDIQEKKLSPYDFGPARDLICQTASITVQDFANNITILEYGDYVERLASMDIWRLTQHGKETIRDLRARRKRLAEFEDMKALINMTPQARGYSFQRLLAEVIENEGWKVKEGARPRGQENDIVITKDLINYFMVSCKWEAEPIEGKEVDHLRARAQGNVCSAGILVSMSGFTPNCKGQALTDRTVKEIVLFGPRDIGDVFINEKTFSDLLFEKIELLKHVNKILVDGIATDRLLNETP